MSDLFRRLNPQQREAVCHVDSPLLVLAGAGSGKTSVITSKIAWLIREYGLKAPNIAAVTFTNKAAREMKQRAGQLLDASESRGLAVSTFHTLGLSILRKNFQAAGLRKGFSIFDNQDSQVLLKEITRQSDLKEEALESALWRISHWKNTLILPESALSHAQDDMELAHARMYQEYERLLLAYNAVDFDDLIKRPVELLNTDENTLEYWRNKIRYLLVDEYQDTNGCQYALVKKLVGSRKKLTVVGDDDQSIYAWRGARPENMALLQQDYADLRVIKLEQNYRSTNFILQAANQVIAHNPHVFEKNLWSSMGTGDRLRVIETKNEQNEAERVVSEIIITQFNRNASPRDFAILYRSNHQARLFEQTLREHEIPYTLSGGTSFFAKREIKDVMAYLRLIVNPEDDAAFLRIINTPKRGIGPSTIEKLSLYAQQRQRPLLLACEELGLGHHLPANAVEKLSEFAQWFQQLTQNAEGENPVPALYAMLEDIAYESHLLEQAPTPSAGERQVKNVHELLRWIDNMGKKSEQEEGRSKTLEEIVRSLVLIDMIERNEEDTTPNAVSLMTLHAAKGLEFKYVFLVGMEEEILPHKGSMADDAGIHEERRLAYVGITRAKEQLILTYAATRKLGGESNQRTPSRFLSELPQDLLIYEGRASDILTPEEKQKKGQANIANLMALLE
jgi:ATP-dependent DNA helicase Rep